MAELRKAVALAPAEIKAAHLNLALARQALARVKERLRIKGEQHKALLGKFFHTDDMSFDEYLRKV